MGKHEPVPNSQDGHYHANCYLCPGNVRANGQSNPHYEGVFVFENDFPALKSLDVPTEAEGSFFKREPVQGDCRVVCFSPNHSLTLAEMTVEGIKAVIRTWSQESRELSQKYEYVQIFENKGEIMGCSSPHPHCQIWSSSFIPTIVHREVSCQSEYFDTTGSPLLLDVVQREVQSQERIIEENDDWIMVVPFWAAWPFETLLIPKRHVTRFQDLLTGEQESLAQILKNCLTRFDNLFQTLFPYSMGWHGAPNNASSAKHWQLHAHFFPPLLRSTSIKKFMVGYEMLAESQRDITPEQAAQAIRNCSTVHFKNG